MNRIVEDVGGIFKITEATGEVHYSTPERTVEEGYRLWQYVTLPILTQEQIDTTAIPHFYVGSFSEYPEESATVCPYLLQSHNLLGRSICERVARIRIAKHLSGSENI